MPNWTKRASASPSSINRLLAPTDYQAVTETPDVGVTREALAMALTRYQFAAGWCDGKRVLEAAGGVGQGLGLLKRRAARVIGGDYSTSLITTARRHYGARIDLVRFDAQALPFGARTFDVVILYEAIYYLARPELFVAEARRILDRGGIVLVCSANPERPDFNPSPLSTRYLTARELARLLSDGGFSVELAGGFPVDQASLRGKLIAGIRRWAVAYGLMPKTMKGKQLLKRLFLGRLVPAPAELAEDAAEGEKLIPLANDQPAANFKVIFAVGKLLAND
jgi:SAM-dependent methyltransferase